MADMAHGSVTRVNRPRVHTDEVEHFVGRTEELAALEAAMRAVRAGQPRAVLVEGEAGVGKSSLVSHFAAEHPDACFHLGHVFDKVGIRSRRALPARLAEAAGAATGATARRS